MLTYADVCWHVLRELKQVQKRLDLALARANRERDTAEMERADKDADLKKLVEQKRALQALTLLALLVQKYTC
jgi:hypothetical protein